MKIVTTLSQKYWKRTGQYTVAEWKSKMPPSVKLWIHDTPTEIPISYDISLDCKGKDKWIRSAETVAKQKTQPPGYYKEWNKLCHKSFAQWECYEYDPQGIMIWMDADMKFRKRLDESVFENLLGDKFCAYLGRNRVDTQSDVYKTEFGQYNILSPETGVIIYNCDHSIAKDFFSKMKDTYLSMDVFNLYDWSDTGVFWDTVQSFDNTHFVDLAENYPPTPFPLIVTPLDEYLEHWMGTKNKKNKSDTWGETERISLKKQGVIK